MDRLNRKIGYDVIEPISHPVFPEERGELTAAARRRLSLLTDRDNLRAEKSAIKRRIQKGKLAAR